MTIFYLLDMVGAFRSTVRRIHGVFVVIISGFSIYGSIGIFSSFFRAKEIMILAYLFSNSDYQRFYALKSDHGSFKKINLASSWIGNGMGCFIMMYIGSMDHSSSLFLNMGSTLIILVHLGRTSP